MPKRTQTEKERGATVTEKDYPSGYEDMLIRAGWEIVESDVHGSYQGDLTFLLRRGAEWGFSVVGYGSCSGCDAYERYMGYGDEPDDLDGLLEFEREVQNSVRAGSAEEVRAYITNEDRDLNWYYHDDEIKAAIDKYAERLTAA